MKRLSLDKVKSKARSLYLKRNTVTIYVPVSEHIYYDGLSYRVRVTRDGIRTSKNFRNFKLASKFEKKLLSSWLG